jgi:CBS domain-containing protein
MEGTGETQVLIPLIVTICVANYIGGLFNEGIYETMIELKNYSYLGHTAKQSMDVVKTLDIMSHPVHCLYPIEKAERIEQILLLTSHNGFPVVDKETRQFFGIVRRDQLVALLECGVFTKDVNHFDELDASSQPYQYQDTIYPNEASLQKVNPSLFREAFNISNDRFGSYSVVFKPNDIVSRNRRSSHEEDHFWLRETMSPFESNVVSVTDDTMPKGTFYSRDDTVVALREGKLVIYLAATDKRKMVNVAAIMNRGAYSVTEGCPLSKTYSMFTSLGLRHLVVLGSGGKVTGMITRSNLLPHNLEEKLKFEL